MRSYACRKSVLQVKVFGVCSLFCGKEFDDTISGMIEKGVFIAITDTKVEGFIAFSDMEGCYVVAEKKCKAFAKRGGGDLPTDKKVRVRVLISDKETLRIDLKLLKIFLFLSGMIYIIKRHNNLVFVGKQPENGRKWHDISFFVQNLY